MKVKLSEKRFVNSELYLSLVAHTRLHTVPQVDFAIFQQKRKT